MFDGVVVVDKPSGMTSHDVVNRIRRIFDTKRVGHTGTLDPLATGVLVICIGHATRIAEYLTAATKEYVAESAFGITTDSQDISGAVLSESDTSGLTEPAVRAVLDKFRGRILQVPPMVSAVHHQGQRLYELARKGVEVDREPREVEVYRLEMPKFLPGSRASASFEVECSTGTYIRTLMADIGEALGCGAIMTSLRRTRVGAFSLVRAITLERLESLKAENQLVHSVHTLSEALESWVIIGLSESDVISVTQGQSVALEKTGLIPDDTIVLLVDREGEPVGIGKTKIGGTIAPVKVFVRRNT